MCFERVKGYMLPHESHLSTNSHLQYRCIVQMHQRRQAPKSLIENIYVSNYRYANCFKNVDMKCIVHDVFLI